MILLICKVGISRENVYHHCYHYCSKSASVTNICLECQHWHHPSAPFLCMFSPRRLFWIRFTKMIHSSKVQDRNLGIFMKYFPKVPSPGVLWHIRSTCLGSLSSSLTFPVWLEGWLVSQINLGNFLPFWRFITSFFTS